MVIVTEALVAAERAGVLVRERGQRDREHQRRAGQVRPAQPGRGHPDDRAGHGRGRRARREHRFQRPLQVQQEQRGDVGADGHERAVADRDLAALPDQHGQPGDRGDVGGDLGDLEVAERVELDGQHEQHDGAQQRQADVASEGHVTPAG